MAKYEPPLVQRGLEPRCTVDEKFNIIDVMFRFQFTQGYLRNYRCSRRKQPNKKNSIRRRIDCSEQPVPLAIDLDHHLIESELVGLGTSDRLQIRLLDPVMNRRTSPFDPKVIK